jgi:hypothetical protein
VPDKQKILDILMVSDVDNHSIHYVWDEAGIAIVLSAIHENSAGLMAVASAECPIGTSVKSGVNVRLGSMGDRSQLSRVLHSLPLDFRPWDDFVEYVCSETIRQYLSIKKAEALSVPTAFAPDAILAMDISETPWLVKDLLIDSGITILASLPKKGKTIIALNLIKAAQDGTQLFERDVPNVPILSLSLEDSLARLKRRMQIIGITGSSSHFVIACDLTQGFDPLRRLMEAYRPRIIVIDTMLAALRIKDENSAELGLAMDLLAKLSREYNISILVLHHHGKSKRDDPILDLRGHSSLSGAVDVILGLYPEETPGQFKLKSASRDGEAIDLDVSFDGNALKWDIDQNFNEVQKIESAGAMLDLLREMGKVSIEAICQANGKSRPVNDKVLKRLLDSGDVTREVSKVGYQTVYVYGSSR